ncbi:xylanase precursor [Stachybotrys elegans]|uniref:Endo-1,4-beta-xylanase n=1 Tax=Stachybotrys elegans TaxID=80388 RepID=A0A8K0WK71_9HYPO|nr:xylanase precursor [Stachybotrys elegans]
MVALSKLLLVSTVCGGAVAAPASELPQGSLLRRESTPNSRGYHDGFYYLWWSDGASDATYKNEAGGGYSLDWQTGGNLLGGKGWNPGKTDRTIEFSGTYEADSNSYLSVYGMMHTPAIEYYIIEHVGTFNPALTGNNYLVKLGTYECDGGTYDLGKAVRVGWGNPATLLLYWGVRREKRTTGVVHTKCHFDAWVKAGLALGEHDEQILASEGYFSNGFSNITVSEVA